MKKRLFSLALVILLLCAIVCPVFASSNGDTVVYRTQTGKCYHAVSCSYLRLSKIEITLADAVARGLSPCSRCNPPRFTDQEESLPKSLTKSTKNTTENNQRSKKPIIISLAVCGILAIVSIGYKTYHGKRS